MIDFSKDLASVLKEVGVSISDGENTTYGTLDIATEDVGGNPLSNAPGIVGQHILVAFATGSIQVAQRATLTVDGTAYTVREIQRIGTGDMTHVLLARKSN